MRSERQPLHSIGWTSNKTMLGWMAAVVIFLVLVTTLPQAQMSLKLTSLNLRDWLMAVGVPFLAIFWMELVKLFSRPPVPGKPSSQNPPG